MRRALRLLGFALAVLLALPAALFGFMQTRPGKDALAAAIARVASRPDARWAIDRLGGSVPFGMTARRITVSDPGGVWLTLSDVRLDIDPRGLLRGELDIRLLYVAEAQKARPAEGPSTPLAELLRMPQLPVALVVDRLTIDRLVLGAPVLGTPIAASVAGNLALVGGAAQAELGIRRIDGSPGRVELQLSLAGAQPRLGLRLEASDPTGILLARALGRADRLPVALSLAGAGPIADWHGRLAGTAGPRARLDADLALAIGAKTALGLSARGDVAPLLPPALAPLVGDRASLALDARLDGGFAIDRLSVAVAAGTLTGDAAFGGPDRAVGAHLRAALPDLSKLGAIAGGELRGAANLTAELSGSEARPALAGQISGSRVAGLGAAAETIDAQLSANPTGALDDPATRIAVAAHGRLAGLALPKGGAWAARFGREIDWSLTVAADRDLHAIDLSRLAVTSGGVALDGAGHLGLDAHGVAGSIDITGAGHDLRTGIPVADALLGEAPTLAGTIRRDDNGIFAIDRLALNGAAVKLTGQGRFDPAARDLSASFALAVPRIEPLQAALGADIAGSLSATLTAAGPLDRLKVESEVTGMHLAAGRTAIDRLRLTAAVADLSQPKAAIDGDFRAGGLDGRLALTAAQIGADGIAIGNLRLTAADSSIAGDLRIAFGTGLVEGSLTARLRDLSRWSRLAGTPLGGSLDLGARLAAAGGGQGLDLTVNGARLAAGSGSARRAIGRLAATARLADLRRRPTGTGRLSLRGVEAGNIAFSAVDAGFDSPRPGRLAFRGTADGRPLSFAVAGEGGLANGVAELRLSRLDGSLGSEKFALEQPLTLSRRGGDLTATGLAMRFGRGRIAGNASLRGEALAATLNATNLPVAAAGRLVGRPGVRGEISLAATIGGTLLAPQGRFTINAAGLSLSAPHHAKTPRLGVTVAGGWNGRTVDLRGAVTGLAGDRMAFTGSLPLVLTRAPLGVSVPPQGPLAFTLQGGGDIGNLADLLPLGEDRLSGKFAADMSVGGTIAAPTAAGRLRLAGARYENFASGAVLNDLAAELVGNGDRFRLASLSAADGAGGSFKAAGSFVLGGPGGPSAQLAASLAHFRIAARDELTATASGTVSVTGPLNAPKITAPLVIDRAEIHLPSSLPPNVVVLKVTEINGRNGVAMVQPAAAASPPLDAALDITLGLSGTVLVQGHGLDSQWRGRLTITGTAEAPKIAGTLVASRGSYTLLGKDFRLTRGRITFDGSAHIDPALDIVAEANAADITAQVVISGFASAPKVALTSTPPLPQDEILSRVLFGSGLHQITPGQGLELAQAAAALAGGGPGLLDRLRGGLGLDWLRFGQGPAGAASSILNPSVVKPETQSAGALSAGKYIAPGVSVGVTQGVSPPTSKVTVEVDLGHHVTVDTEAGQNIGTGIGLSYNFDY